MNIKQRRYDIKEENGKFYVLVDRMWYPILKETAEICMKQGIHTIKSSVVLIIDKYLMDEGFRKVLTNEEIINRAKCNYETSKIIDAINSMKSEGLNHDFIFYVFEEVKQFWKEVFYDEKPLLSKASIESYEHLLSCIDFHLDRLNKYPYGNPLNKNLKSNPKSNYKEKRDAKYYALYHRILIEMGIEKPFIKNEKEQFVRREIEAFAKDRYKLKDGQVFYRHFKDIYNENPLRIALSFGKGYKDKIIELSDKNAKVIRFLKDWPE